MPFSAPRHCAQGHPPFTGRRCPECRAAYERSRPSAYRRGYGAGWQAASQAFLTEHPCCANCGRPATEVHHIVPHRGDSVLFWNERNWQGLCKPCHSRLTAAQSSFAGG